MRPPPRAVALAILLVGPLVVSARQEPARSPRNANYTITATLDPGKRQLLGQGHLSWRNLSTQPASELHFHMYWNAWRDDASSWMRERRLVRDAQPARPPELRGSTELTQLNLVTASGSSDLLSRAHYIAPDDGNPDDRTLLSVPLDRPVAPGETVEIDFGWAAQVPRPYARTGVTGNYFFIAQWFPKIGVLANDGWKAPQFHSATEFFSDFGTYDVRLTVPTGWVVGATGRQQAVTDNSNGTATHRYVENDVHDFAWTTSPDFVDVHERFEEPGLPAVDMRLLLQPEHRDQASRHFAATRVALKYFGNWFGPYPYGHITIVDPIAILDPAVQGESTAGMEYPTLVTAGTRWGSPWKASQPEEVTVHEVGHQFWYGIVANNEFEHAWMDEGLTTFATARAMAEEYPGRFVGIGRYFGGMIAWPYDDVAWSRDITGNRSSAYRLNATSDAPATPTWRYWPSSAASTTYAKTAVWLTTLERHLGWNTLQKVLAAHFARGAFRHPTPEEFFAIASEVSGQDLTWFFDNVYRSSAAFDYSVAKVTGQPATGGAVSSTVVVRRLADGIFPVTVRVRFSDGTTLNERWDGRDRWRAFRYDRPASVETVEVNPQRVLALDVNFTNNSWTAHPRAADAAHTWALRWLTWFEQVLMTYAFFA